VGVAKNPDQSLEISFFDPIAVFWSRSGRGDRAYPGAINLEMP
jgi:hypothetical protein